MNPKICFTAAGILIFQKKVLLVKHKKLGVWLNPGGHIEQDELPHHAAEREFFEETGIRVQAYDARQKQNQNNFEDDFFIPNPLLTNVHWICKENFEERQRLGAKYIPDKVWNKGCEQHCNFLYLVRPLEGTEFAQNTEETDGIDWFSEEEIPALTTKENIRTEIEYAFSVV